MGKTIDYTSRQFGGRTYGFYGDFRLLSAAKNAAATNRRAGRPSRVTFEANAAKARINNTGRYLVWVRGYHWYFSGGK